VKSASRLDDCVVDRSKAVSPTQYTNGVVVKPRSAARRAVGGIVGRLCNGSLLLGRCETLSPYSPNQQISRKMCRARLEKVDVTAGWETGHSGINL
jgi:hypothetical protein